MTRLAWIQNTISLMMEVVSPHVIPHFISVTHINATLLVQTINTMITTKIASPAVILLFWSKIPFIAISLVPMESILKLILETVSHLVIQFLYTMTLYVDFHVLIPNFISLWTNHASLAANLLLWPIASFVILHVLMLKSTIMMVNVFRNVRVLMLK